MLSFAVMATVAVSAFTPCPIPTSAFPKAQVEIGPDEIGADIFAADAPLSEAAMSAAAGGEAAAFDISQLGLNISSSNGAITGVTVDNDSDTGAITNNAVNGNSGITAVFNNTGNGVIFQNTVQVNVFLNGPQ